VRAAYHADPAVVPAGELRSEQVTVLARAGQPLCCIGFDGGDRHAGTLRLRRDDRDHIVVTAEAWFGGAELPPGTTRELHSIAIEEGDDASMLLEAWATRVGARANARVTAPFVVGWCSWYQYFHDVDERAVRDNLERASDWPFTVFQLDDGYQRDIGDWRATNEKFPHGVDGVANAIAGAGYEPGIWIAPFLAAPNSDLAANHPDWLARAPATDSPAIGMFHEVWGGLMWQLDTTHPEVVAHLESLARDLVAMGYRYLKLDFTFSAAMPGRFHDATATPAQRVRAGYDAIRRGAGDDVFILGCGAPLGPLVGAVDGMRIGADVAPSWERDAAAAALPGYEAAAPATRHAFVNTCTRAWQHRKLWSNDPDCIMLRTHGTGMDAAAVEAWALAVGMSGGLILVSDDLTQLGADARERLAEVIALGRSADAAVGTGSPPRCPDLLEPTGPTTLVGGGSDRLVLEPARPSVEVRPQRR
jgi:alpha-galactosidase